MKRAFAIHNAFKVEIINGKMVHGIDPRVVRILAIAEGWAMVRRIKGATYCCPVKELEVRP